MERTLTARQKRILEAKEERENRAEDRFWDKQWVHEELQAKHGEERK